MMDLQNRLDERVHQYYWENDYNCATTMLKILAEIYCIELSPHLLDAAVGMHGAGKYGAQCGLVEGSLMFIGLYGRVKGRKENEIVKLCYGFAEEFNNEFNSLNCRELRPEGFRDDNPPHLCENFSKRAVRFSVDYLRRL
jgi:C_GCAxxG_C_C family probable redox protein